MSILVERTPNPNAMKFTANKQLFKGEQSYPLFQGETSDYPVLNDCLDISGVDNVFGYQHFITIIKKPSADWSLLKEKVIETIEAHGY